MSHEVAPIHRVAIGFAAIAATAVVIGVGVVAPAGLDPAGTQAQASASAPGPRVVLSDVVVVPAGVGTPVGDAARVVSAQGRELPAKSKQQI